MSKKGKMQKYIYKKKKKSISKKENWKCKMLSSVHV